jgi:hypothetical protein
VVTRIDRLARSIAAGKTACERRRKQSHRRPGTKQKPERFRPYAAHRQERRQR